MGMTFRELIDYAKKEEADVRRRKKRTSCKK